MKHKSLNKIFTVNRLVWIIIALMLCPTVIKAQSDSLSYTQESRQDSTIAYLSPLEYAFMMHEETNWLLKANLLIATENRNIETLKLSLEKKIAPGFSLNAVLLNIANFSIGNNLSYGMEFSLESRWYYKMRRNIRENKSTANLSGTYLALGTGYRKVKSDVDYFTVYSNLDFLQVFAKWGLQRRFLKRGYVDFGIRAGTNFSLNGIHSPSLQFGTYVDAGLAFARDKHKLDFDKLCPVLKCHSADRFLLKTNLVDIINITYVRKSFFGSFSPNIAAELKIGTSPFSINSKLGLRLGYQSSGNYDFNIFSLSPQLLVESRYYYNLNRRILMGKSGNGLSANYVSLGALFQGDYWTTQSYGVKADVSETFIGVLVSTGIQRLITDHLYFDLNIGVGYGDNYKYDGLTKTNSHKEKSILLLGVGIGYRF